MAGIHTVSVFFAFFKTRSVVVVEGLRLGWARRLSRLLHELFDYSSRARDLRRHDYLSGYLSRVISWSPFLICT